MYGDREKWKKCISTLYWQMENWFYWHGISSAALNRKYYGTSYVFKSTIKALFLAIPYNLVRYSFERIKGADKSFVRELKFLSNWEYVKESLGLNWGDRK